LVKQKTHDCRAIVGFLEICFFRLENGFHVAPGPAAGSPVGAAHLRAMLAGLNIQGNERRHSNGGY
jgi:hypothetical protein